MRSLKDTSVVKSKFLIGRKLADMMAGRFLSRRYIVALKRSKGKEAEPRKEAADPPVSNSIAYRSTMISR